MVKILNLVINLDLAIFFVRVFPRGSHMPHTAVDVENGKVGVIPSFLTVAMLYFHMISVSVIPTTGYARVRHPHQRRISGR